MKYEYESPIMNGDTVKFNGVICTVSITGYQGAYKNVNGKYTNCATGDTGYLTVIETTEDKKESFPVGYEFRAEWTDRGLQMVKPAIERI